MFGKMKCLSFWKIAIICLVFASVYENGFSADKKKDQVNQAEKIFYASRTAFARVDPDKDADIVREVKQGERLKEIGFYDLPNWIRVKLSDGKIGWIPKSVVATTIEKERGKWEIKKEKDIHKQGYTEKSPEEKKIEVYIRQIKEDRYSPEGEKAYNCLVKIGRPAIIYLVRALKDKEIDHFDRSYYAEILGKIGDPSAIPALTEALKNEEICRSAANALGDIGDETAIPDLIKVILSVPYKPDSYFSSYTSYGSCAGAAANALGKIGRPAVPPLVKILQRISDSLGGGFSKDYIVKALGATRDKSAIPPLIELLQEKDCGVAVEALGIIGDKSAIPVLAKKAEEGTWSTWGHSEGAETRRALSKIVYKQNSSTLLSILKNKNLENCYRFWELVLSSLYEKNGPAVISIYKRLKNEVNNRHLKEMITEKIEKVNLEKIEMYIRQIKEDRYSSEGEKAYNRLVKIGRPAIIYLVRALKDKEISHFDRSYYAEILGKIGDPSAIPALIEALKNEEICRSAANALGDIGDETAIPDLIKVILLVPYKPYPFGRERCPDSYFSSWTSYGSCAGAAANALGKIGRPAVPPLVKTLQKISNPLGGWSSKDYIVKALGATRDKSAIPPLIELLQEKHCGVAVEALGIIGDKSAVPALIKVLKSEDKEGWARAEAATSLGKIADKSTIPVLIEALGFGGQDSSEIRKASVVALGEIGDKSAIPVLAKKAEEGTWSTWGHSEGAETRRALNKIVYKQNSSTLLSILKNKNLENCYRFWELVLSSLYEKNGPAVISIYKRLKNEVNNRHLKEMITEKIEKVNLELEVKRDLSGSLIKYAVEYRKCLKQFRFLEYQLKYKTTSDKFEIRTKELQSFVKTKLEPISKKFSYAMGVYSEKYGAMKLRDFAITHGFLDLLK